MSETSMSAPQILEESLKIQRERGKEYDSPEGERSFAQVTEAFNILTGHNLRTSQGWLFAVLLKIVRSEKECSKIDSPIDLTSYSSLYGEERIREIMASMGENK